MKIVGSYLSPYVRKVLACLGAKGIDYEIDPIVPFFGNDEFARISPLRRVPVMIDGDLVLADSTVICEYLEDRYPDPPLLPHGAEARARCRWLEEYADSRMGEVFIWHYYNQFIIRKYVWGLPPDDEVVRKAVDIEIPHILDYLESVLPDAGFLFESLSIADIAIASFFRNAAFARFNPDPGRWPRTAAFVARILSLDCLGRMAPFEELSLKTPIAAHRDTLRAAGAPVSDHTYVAAAPRPGLLST